MGFMQQSSDILKCCTTVMGSRKQAISSDLLLRQKVNDEMLDKFGMRDIARRALFRFCCKWSIMACSQSAARTANRNLLVASRAKAFLGRPTNSGSILTRAANLDGGLIERHQCITT